MSVLVCALVLGFSTACRGDDDRPNELGSPTSDGQGVYHHLTEAQAEHILGFRPVRPEVLPVGFEFVELWGQASLVASSIGRNIWDEPSVAIYEINSVNGTGPAGMQLHQSPVNPVPTGPSGIAPWDPIDAGGVQAEKSVIPVGTSGVANVVYRRSTGGLNYLIFGTTGAGLSEAEVESLIAGMPSGTNSAP